MSDYQNLIVENKGGVALVTINRPAALNALNSAVLAELDQAMAALGTDRAVRAVVLTGAGEKAFVAGADITEMQPMNPSQGRSFGKFGAGVFTRIENLPQPVIAAVNGFALGGGCELAMACDIRVASENAKFGQPEVTLGIIPGFGGTQRLARLVGKGRAKQILYTGDLIDSAEALRIGLVNAVFPVGQVVEAALGIASRIANRAPYAVELCKTAVNRGGECDLETAIAYESEAFGLCFASIDQKEGMTAFVEKRKPSFIGA